MADVILLCCFVLVHLFFQVCCSAGLFCLFISVVCALVCVLRLFVCLCCLCCLCCLLVRHRAAPVSSLNPAPNRDVRAKTKYPTSASGGHELDLSNLYEVNP